MELNFLMVLEAGSPDQGLANLFLGEDYLLGLQRGLPSHCVFMWWEEVSGISSYKNINAIVLGSQPYNLI